MKMKRKNTIIMLSVLLVLSVTVFSSLNGQVVKTDETKLIIQPVPENLEASFGEAAWRADVLDLTIDKLVQESDLVLLVDIESGMTYSKYPNHPFSIYEAKVLQVYRGTFSDKKINIMIREGYIKENWYIRAEGEPNFSPSEEWVLFLNPIEYESSFELKLPDNTYRPVPTSSLKVIDNKLIGVYPAFVDNNNINGINFSELDTLLKGN